MSKKKKPIFLMLQWGRKWITGFQARGGEGREKRKKRKEASKEERKKEKRKKGGKSYFVNLLI